MGNDNGLVHCVLEGVDDLDDKALLKHLKGVAKVHTRNALMNLYENLLEIKSKSSARDPLYKELIKCLLRNSVYSPQSMNLDKNIGEIMTWANCQEVLKNAGIDPEDGDHDIRLAGYIRNLARRLSPSGIKRSNNKVTPAIKFYDEYRIVFEPHDPFNLKNVTERVQKEMSSNQSETAHASECPEHISFNTNVLMVDARSGSSEEGRDIRVYKLGQARSCTGGLSCTCRDSVHILVKEVCECPYTDENLIEDTDLHDALESGPLSVSPPEFFQKDTYTQKKEYKEAERLEQLSEWVKQKKTEVNWTRDDEVFVCPRPKNKQTGDLESQLGNWLNSKSCEAKDKKKRENQRLKAINLLNGSVAEILGYKENWFCEPPVRRGNTKYALSDATNTGSGKRSKRAEKITDLAEPSKHMGPGVRSKRARQVKPNRNPLYAY
eukprot:jgi/Picre1/33338/NNA_008662.t1